MTLPRDTYIAYSTLCQSKVIGRWNRFKLWLGLRLIGSLTIDAWEDDA